VLVLVALPIAIYVILWIYHLLLSELAVAAPIAAVPLVALLVALIGPYLLVHYEVRIRAALAGAIRAIWQFYRRSPLGQAIARRFPGLMALLNRLFGSSPMAGLLLISVLFAASAAVWFFVALLVQVVTGASLTATDTRALNLVVTLRTPAADHVFYAITLMGSAETVVVVAGVGILVALLAARYEDALMIAFSVVAGTVFFTVIKLVVARPRPPLEDARYVQSGFSFPSGHSTISAALYGTLAYLLIRGMRREGAKVTIWVVAALLVSAIGISRVYLGVHYPSDVLAGWLGGSFWVLLIIAAEDLWPPRVAKPLPSLWRVADVAVAVVLTAGGVVYLTLAYRNLPPPPTITPPTPTTVVPAAVPSTVESSLPHYTEGLFGNQQEPVSAIFIGKQGELVAAFQAGGWTEAELFGFGSTVHAFVSGLTGRADPAGPVTPSYLGDEPNALAFELAVGKTFAKRHHIRLWKTNVVTSDGQPVWEATASFDEGLELAPDNGFPTHKIAPNIDAERDFVLTSLQNGGDVTSEQTIQLVPPEQGHNFAGDPFFTDGQAYVIFLRP
jgi:undecaprenyl-diphosphatase